ncbi:GNAT family N-acetyltransferase [Actinospica sp. MGRD01-02]|uniref:GNAT family N-acetyltransferase n=1 Tax=Actinospica acidithermotolerans TaxID=2828514 RepID=A0A941EAS0_9ACTN|nr:GNAT family N-acetyltransferase [Actinospica acidithermotolerans]MBR7827153.1 GNAT family N-acetyltransferase [Actinospica acidithermotolerans]
MDVMPQAAVTRYGSYAELPGAMLEDTMLLIETDPGVLHGAWTASDGYAFASVDGYGGDPCWLNVVGPPETSAALIEAALGELGGRCCGMTVPRGLDVAPWLRFGSGGGDGTGAGAGTGGGDGTGNGSGAGTGSGDGTGNGDGDGDGDGDEAAAEAAAGTGAEVGAVAADGLLEPSQWDAMRCDAPPPVQPGEERVRPIEDLAALQEFLDRVNPHHSVRADHPEVERWLGARDAVSGELLAVGAFTRRRRGTAYLASIATAEAARGQGLGAAVTAALTRHAFTSGDTVCTLAHYHPNEPARRIYLRLGYRTTHQSQSVQFGRRREAGCP